LALLAKKSPDLARLIDAWPNLSAPIRAAMLALINSASATSGIVSAASGDAQYEQEARKFTYGDNADAGRHGGRQGMAPLDDNGGGP